MARAHTYVPKETIEAGTLALLGDYGRKYGLTVEPPVPVEEILFLPRSDGGRDPIREKAVRPIATVPDFRKQRVMWRDLKVGLPD